MLLIAFRFPLCNFSGVRIAVGRAHSAGSLAHGLWARYWVSGVLWMSQRSVGIAGGGQKGGRIESRGGGGWEGKASETNTLCCPYVLAEHLLLAQGEQLEPGTVKPDCPARVGGQRCLHHGSVSTSRNMALYRHDFICFHKIAFSLSLSLAGNWETHELTS